MFSIGNFFLNLFIHLRFVYIPAEVAHAQPNSMNVTSLLLQCPQIITEKLFRHSFLGQTCTLPILLSVDSTVIASMPLTNFKIALFLWKKLTA